MGLDPNQILEIRALIKTLAKDRTVIISSHILPEIASSCNRLVIISQGRIVAQDTTERLSRLADGVGAIKIVGPNISKGLKQREAALKETFKLERIEGLDPDTVILYKKQSHTILEAVPPYLVRAGIAFTEYGPYGRSLEDIFRKLTLTEGNREGIKRVMKKILSLCQRELYSLFVSPVAYVVCASFLFIYGYFFVSSTLAENVTDMSAVMGNMTIVILC